MRSVERSSFMFIDGQEVQHAFRAHELDVHVPRGSMAPDAESRTRVLTRRQKSRQSYRGFDPRFSIQRTCCVSGYDVLYGTGSTPHSARPGNESNIRPIRIRPVLRLTGTLMRYVFKYFCLMSYAVCNPSVPHHQPLPSALTEVHFSHTSYYRLQGPPTRRPHAQNAMRP